MKGLQGFADTIWGPCPLPNQIKRGVNGCQDKETPLLVFTANLIPREKAESPQTEGGSEGKTQFQILKQNQTWRLRQYSLCPTPFFFLISPKFLTPSNTKRPFGSQNPWFKGTTSFWNLLLLCPPLSLLNFSLAYSQQVEHSPDRKICHETLL